MTRALLLASLVTLPFAASGASRQRIAVLDIRAIQGVSAGSATMLTAIVVDGASRAGFDVISQADVSAMIGFEKQKQMLGCKDDSSCLAEIGGALGVDYVLSGQVGQIGSRLHLSFQLLDSRKAKVVARAARFSGRDEDALAAAAEAVEAEILAEVPGREARAQSGTASANAGAQKETEKAEGSSRADAKGAKASASTSKRSQKADLEVRPLAPSAPAGQVGRTAFHPTRRLAWWTLGGGAALLAGGVIFGMKAESKRTALANSWADPNYASIYDQKSGEVRTAAMAADVLFVAGAATTGLGTWFYWKSRAPVAVAPSVAGGQVGLVAGGSF